ncbi:hypothetical protein S101267_00319 [Bacillus amyloliquefaciens]|nr:hypothetical protein S101267_00319 [Bacillus amyloliquefaciens]
MQINTRPITNQISASGTIKRSHFTYGMPLAANTAISTPEVGLTQFTTPPPSMTASIRNLSRDAHQISKRRQDRNKYDRLPRP